MVGWLIRLLYHWFGMPTKLCFSLARVELNECIWKAQCTSVRLCVNPGRKLRKCTATTRCQNYSKQWQQNTFVGKIPASSSSISPSSCLLPAATAEIDARNPPISKHTIKMHIELNRCPLGGRQTTTTTNQNDYYDDDVMGEANSRSKTQLNYPSFFNDAYNLIITALARSMECTLYEYCGSLQLIIWSAKCFCA